MNKSKPKRVLKNLLLGLFLVLFLASSFPFKVYAEGDTAMRYGVDAEVKQNGTVYVSICITAQETVDAVQLYLEYDPNAFELDESSSWMLDRNMPFNDKFHSITNFVQNGKGTISLVHWQEQVKTDADGMVAVVAFRAKEDAPVGPAIFNLTYSANNVAPFVSTLESGKINDSAPHAMKTEVKADKVPEPVREYIKPMPLPTPAPQDNQGYVPTNPGIKVPGNSNDRNNSNNNQTSERPRRVLQPVAAVPEEEEEEEPRRIKSKSGKISAASLDKLDEIEEEEDEIIDEEDMIDTSSDTDKKPRKRRNTGNKLISEYGEELLVPLSPLAKHRIPEGFGPQTLTIRGIEIQGYTSSKYNLTLYYLQAPNKQATLYQYNKEFDCFEEYDVSKLSPQSKEGEDDEKLMEDNQKSFDVEKDEDKTSPVALAAVSLVGASSFGIFVMSLFKQLRL